MKLIFVFFIAINIILSVRGQNGQLNNILEYCQQHINLTDSGLNSSISLSVPYLIKTHQLSCRIKIQVPDTHLIYLKIEEQDLDDEKLFEKEIEEVLLKDNCPLNILAPSTPSYTKNLCNKEYLTSAEDEGVGLFGNQVEISFNPSVTTKTKHWTLTITAVGTGEFCLNSEQFSCLQTSWTPLLCVSKELLCNGIVNCPTDDLLSDENPQLCKDKQNTNWEKLANDFLKKITSKSKTVGSLLPAIQKGRNNFRIQSTTIQPEINSTTTNLNNLSLSEYGPWGYLMLGMLICGTVLTFCGLWECCCRKTKTQQTLNNDDDSGTTPSSVIITSGVSTTAILTTTTSGPPKYDELDQPPSYNVLFPAEIKVA